MCTGWGHVPAEVDVHGTGTRPCSLPSALTRTELDSSPARKQRHQTLEGSGSALGGSYLSLLGALCSHQVT